MPIIHVTGHPQVLDFTETTRNSKLTLTNRATATATAMACLIP